jgi:hypothetical protein
MGWTFTPSRGRDRAEIIRERISSDNDTIANKVIDLAVVGTTVYVLCCLTPKTAWKPDATYINDADGSIRWIAVVLTRKARDAYDFGYKDMCVPGGFRTVAF